MPPYMFSYGRSGDRALQVFWGMCELGKVGGGLACCLSGEQPRGLIKEHQELLTTPGLQPLAYPNRPLRG